MSLPASEPLRRCAAAGAASSAMSSAAGPLAAAAATAAAAAWGPCRSAVSAGALFEGLCAVALLGALPSLRLRPRGGAGDGGVDLVGSLAGAPVLAQCKNQTGGGAVGAAAVRDLLGVVARAGGARAPPAAGLLVSATAFTRPAVLAAFAGQAPLLLAHLSLVWAPAPDGGGGGARAAAVATVQWVGANRAFVAAFPAVSLRLPPADMPPDWLHMNTLEGTPVMVELRHAPCEARHTRASADCALR